VGNGVRPVERNRETQSSLPVGSARTQLRAQETGEAADAPREARQAWVERGGAADGATGSTTSTETGRAPLGRLGAGARAPLTELSDSPSTPNPSTPRPVIGARAAQQKDDSQPSQRTLPEIRYNSADAGNFYCEHVYFVAQEQALASSSSVLSNSDGHRLVGFIHLPEDAQTTRAPNPSPTAADLAARHGDTRRVMGAAIAGYYNEAAAQTTGPVRIMVTGFGPFSNITDNPSGDFVSHRANIDAAMEQAFGTRLVGRPPAGADMNQPLTYQVRQDDGSVRDVQIRALRLPVTDAALDPAQRGSIPSEMASFRPHAVISMGVRPGSSGHYDVEGRADDGGLARGSGGSRRHEGGRTNSGPGHTNGSLRSAIEWARVHPAR
jgi:pyrrolidone-carboxylate peptidase